MLDSDTKRRIDTARDILVGKVPDPKSQVEQITIAMIYKFMDDMDAEAEELGGKRTFFAKDYARYGWAKLMRSGLGGHETLALYAEAITKMPENPGIPALFRDIFKNAYLPYRDPETLRAFLKIIDEFTYDHSEKLGDAFEYLLSVLGSQGDAGQFRSPRHIIDFMVAIIDPKKTESLLDPACGTVGFLISAFKHILRANTHKKGHSTLTPDDKARLAANFKGYDISPDMVRLSLVNLYLHGFTEPHVYEYDTLTSLDRWNEYFDVILANPPFMSPKGGIKPHKRFSIQAKRSEVLFVDYIAEHLTPNGRAAIIVPEGIIFQSQGAYKDLRKMLVENSLVAVISLPAGCFNPYSGVKTSILILDKALARQSDSIGFFKVENDGYGLGAQRRAVEGEQLTQVKADVAAFLQALRDRESTADLQPTCGLIVPKEKIAANGDYNLSGERYREGVVSVSSWPFVSVGDAFKKGDQTVIPESLDGPVTYLGLENITQNTGGIEGNVVTENPSDIKSLKNVFKPRDILYGKLRPNLNKVWLADREGICSTDVFVIKAIEGIADPALYAYLFRSARFNDAVMGQLKGAQLPRIGWSSFAELQIPLPPLEAQQELVAEIEGYQKVINGARAVLDHYRPHIPIHPDWPMVELSEVIESKPKNGYSGKPVDRVTDLKVLSLSATTSGTLDLSKSKYLDEEISLNSPCRCRNGDIYLQRGNTAELVGTAALYDVDDANYIYPDLMIRVRADETKIITRYLLTALKSQPVREFLTRNAVGAAGSMPKINQGIVERVPIPLPPLATQRAIVAEIEAEQALVAANRELITRFEQKIQTTLARVWGEEKDEG
jgi:type I restriction enzyme M protein